MAQVVILQHSICIKDVIENGILLDYNINHKDRGYDSAVIAAPIEIAGERYICYTTIIRNKKGNRYYLHEVWTQKNLTDVRSNAAQKQLFPLRHKQRQKQKQRHKTLASVPNLPKSKISSTAPTINNPLNKMIIAQLLTML